MLKEKDFCNYDTCMYLIDFGYFDPDPIDWYVDDYDHIAKITLYEAQKWLREEKGIDVMVIRDYWCNTKYNPYCRHYFPKLYRKYGSFEKAEKVGGVPTYDSYEEALSEGIKEAVKFLKENETIHG